MTPIIINKIKDYATLKDHQKKWATAFNGNRPTILHIYPLILADHEIKNGETFLITNFKKLITKNQTNVCILKLVNKSLCVSR